jgi:hypothetical protein
VWIGKSNFISLTIGNIVLLLLILPEVWQGGVGCGKRGSIASPLFPFKKKTRLAKA